MTMLVKTSLSYLWQMSKMMACTEELKTATFTYQQKVTLSRQSKWKHIDKHWEAAASTGTEVQVEERALGICNTLYLRISLNLVLRRISQPCTLGRAILHSLIFPFISHWDLSHFSTFMFILQAFRDTIFPSFTDVPIQSFQNLLE